MPRSRSAQVVGFRDWLAGLEWEQGQHVTMLGTTGTGKTTVARALLGRRGFVAVLATKASDPQLDRFVTEGYKVIEEWPPPDDADRVIVWPPFTRLDQTSEQRAIMLDVVESVWQEGGWTLYVDEVLWLSETLKLGRPLELLWQQGRSNNITVVAATQRPFSLPQEALSQASIVLVWRMTDARDLKRLTEISGAVDSKLLARTVASLPPHAFAVVNTRTGSLTVTRMPAMLARV